MLEVLLLTGDRHETKGIMSQSSKAKGDNTKSVGTYSIGCMHEGAQYSMYVDETRHMGAIFSPKTQGAIKSGRMAAQGAGRGS